MRREEIVGHIYNFLISEVDDDEEETKVRENKEGNKETMGSITTKNSI